MNCLSFFEFIGERSGGAIIILTIVMIGDGIIKFHNEIVDTDLIIKNQKAVIECYKNPNILNKDICEKQHISK